MSSTKLLPNPFYRNDLNHLESSSSKIIRNGPIVSKLCVITQVEDTRFKRPNLGGGGGGGVLSFTTFTND